MLVSGEDNRRRTNSAVQKTMVTCVANAERHLEMLGLEPVAAYHLLGVKINPLTIGDLHTVIATAIEKDDRVVIVSQNLHGVYLYHRTEKMRHLHTRSLVRIDGMSLIIAGRILGRSLHRGHRVTWVDWIDPFMAEVARRKWRVFYLGSKPGVVERGISVLRNRHKGLEIAFHHGHFDATPNSGDNQRVLAAISQFQPHILMVGMGMPRQETWVYDNLGYLRVNAILTCGAAIDYVAGALPTPPRWMGRLGLEWLYRLVCEPKRLGFRYLVEPWALSGLFVRDVWRHIRSAEGFDDRWIQ